MDECLLVILCMSNVRCEWALVNVRSPKVSRKITRAIAGSILRVIIFYRVKTRANAIENFYRAKTRANAKWRRSLGNG